MKKRAKRTAAILLAAVGAPALAHHSFFAEFDPEKEVMLEGEVIKMEWINPHSWLHIAVENEQGEVEEWKVEGGSPGVLLRLGWTRDAFPPGTEVTVRGFQAKDGSHRANARSVEFPNGRVLETGGSQR